MAKYIHRTGGEMGLERKIIIRWHGEVFKMDDGL